VQAIGAGVIAAGGSSKLGGDIVLSGLILQIVVFGFFVCIGLRFHVKLHQKPTGPSALFDWKRYMLWLYIMSLAITSRNIYRVVEYCMGGKSSPNVATVLECADFDAADGYIMTHEWTLYVFDAAMMVLVLSLSIMSYSLTKDSRGDRKLLAQEDDISMDA